MKINQADFVTSVHTPGDYPFHQQPEFTFAGRSNVGKSSLINMVLNRKKLARTSSTPGRTQSINFYKINNDFYFSDLPGYGFARVPEEVKENWRELINDYLHYRKNLVGIIMIVDARHKPTEDDKTMLQWIESVNLPWFLAATKADKLSNNEKRKQEKIIKKELGLAENDWFTFVSAVKRKGRKQIHGFIQQVLTDYRQRG